MESELSLKNKRVRIWLWLMVPAIIISLLLFINLPREHSVLGTSPLIIGYFIYVGWYMFKKRQKYN